MHWPKMMSAPSFKSWSVDRHMATSKVMQYYRFIACLLLSILILGASCATVRAQVELIEAVDLLEDKSSIANLQDLLTEDFVQSHRSIILGYRTSAFWLRMRILPAPDGGNVILTVNPPMLDDVQLFVPTPISTIEPEIIFDGSPYELTESITGLTTRTYILPPTNSRADYFLRITSIGSISIDVSAQSADDAIRTNNTVHFPRLIYLSIMVLLLMLAIRAFALSRDPFLLFLPVLSCLWIFHNLFSFGYISIILPIIEASNLQLIFRYLVLIISIILFLFHRSLILKFRPPCWAISAINAMLALTLVPTIVFVTYSKTLALEMNIYLALVSPVIFLLASVTARENGFMELNHIRVFYFLLCAVNAIWAARLLGLNFGFILKLNGAMTHGLATSSLFLFILIKYNLQVSNSIKMDRKRLNELHQNQIVENEKRKSLIGYIDMLTHETKNALSVISLTISAAKIDSLREKRIKGAISGLNDVIDRSDQSIRLHDIDKQLEMQKCTLTDILDKICADHIENHRIVLKANSQPVIVGDPIFLDIVFSNLLENAVKYSPVSSNVLITLDVKRGDAVMVFENEQGASGAPDPEMVFKKHYRNQRVQGIAGSGLGLHICHRIVCAHNGNIFYSSEDGRIKFTVRFPCAI